MDGQLFLLGSGDKAKGRTVGSASVPVGRFALKPNVILCEGSSDFLAAYHFADLEGLADDFSPVAVLGASNRIHPDFLGDFAGRNILAFPDYDGAGIRAVKKWWSQLQPIANRFSVFDYEGLVRDDGQAVKDLRDFVRVSPDGQEKSRDVRHPLRSFLQSVGRGKIS
jgi:hypothetical protein